MKTDNQSQEEMREEFEQETQLSAAIWPHIYAEWLEKRIQSLTPKDDSVEWISVKKERPEIGVMVNFVLKHTQNDVYTGFRAVGGWYCYTIGGQGKSYIPNNTEGAEITHWMPLPSPPAESEQAEGETWRTPESIQETYSKAGIAIPENMDASNSSSSERKEGEDVEANAILQKHFAPIKEKINSTTDALEQLNFFSEFNKAIISAMQEYANRREVKLPSEEEINNAKEKDLKGRALNFEESYQRKGGWLACQLWLLDKIKQLNGING